MAAELCPLRRHNAKAQGFFGFRFVWVIWKRELVDAGSSEI